MVPKLWTSPEFLKEAQKAVDTMYQHHREACFSVGDHPDEVDTHFSMAAEALRFTTYYNGNIITLDQHKKAVVKETEDCADVCNDRGVMEEANFGLTRATQNYYRARDSIRARVNDSTK